MIEDNWDFADLHIHSRFSRACSKDLTFPNLVKWAKIKGVSLLGTGDFTHPVWLDEIKEQLEDKGNGLYYFEDFPFVISGEVSLMYTHGKGRRVHLVLLVPSVEVAEKINSYLDTKGRRDYDGRPIFKIPVEEFVREMKNISEDIEVIPAHIWTPWFGIFGSATGYNSLKEAFGEQFDKISAIETGISSDPPLNWKIRDLGDKSILSFSDSHSFWPWRLGREVTIFKSLGSYLDLINQIRENSFIGTVETDPAYGKYHWDGHRLCNFSCSPQKTRELNGICPKCNKSLVIGVENRVEELASGTGKDYSKKKMFFTLLPLHELIAYFLKAGVNTKKVWGVYNSLIEKFGNEFKILIDIGEEELKHFGLSSGLIDLILKNREGKIKVKPGYDGEYGVIELGEKIGQAKLD